VAGSSSRGAVVAIACPSRQLERAGISMVATAFLRLPGSPRRILWTYTQGAICACRFNSTRYARHCPQPHAFATLPADRGPRPVLREDSIRWCGVPLPPAVIASRPMRTFIPALLASLRAAMKSRAALALEKAAPRQQSAVHLRTEDRLFWAALRRLWHDWTRALVIVKPETVIRWHRSRIRN